MAAKRGSILYEIITFVTFLIIAVSFVMSYSFITQNRNSLESEIRLRGMTLGRAIANSISDGLLTSDDLMVSRILTDAMKNKGVTYVTVVNKAGLVYSGNNLDLNGSRYKAPENVISGPDSDGILLYSAAGSEKMLDFSVPVVAKGQFRIGTVHLGITYSLVEAVLNSMYINAGIITLVAVLLGIAGACLLGVTITKPLKSLAKSVKIIGTGDLTHRITIKSGNEIGMLATIFNMMARDLKNSQQLAVKQEIMDRDIEVAKQIQLALMPKKIQEVPGFEVGKYYMPTKQVGGDYYDIKYLSDNRYAFIVADVSGKGVPAALIMAMMKSVVDSEAKPNLESHDTMKRLNNRIYPDLKSDMFITAFYCVMDTSTSVLDISSAGHTGGLVFRAATGEVMFHNPRGIPIGADPGPKFDRIIQNDRVPLHRGDVIVVFTDGITEAMNAEHQQYKMSRLITAIKACATMKAEQITNYIVSDVRRFAGDSEQSDDIALLVLKKS